MFEVDEIKELIRAVTDSKVAGIEVHRVSGEKLVIKGFSENTSNTNEKLTLTPQSLFSEQGSEISNTQKKDELKNKTDEMVNDETLVEVVSPMIGTFYHSPSPEAEAYVSEGNLVKEDTVICVIETMKLMNELEAKYSGEIIEILVSNGELVDYGQPLFLLKPI